MFLKLDRVALLFAAYQQQLTASTGLHSSAVQPQFNFLEYLKFKQ